MSNDFKPALINHIVDKGITCGNGTKDSVSGHSYFENWSDLVILALRPLVKFNKSFFWKFNIFRLLNLSFTCKKGELLSGTINNYHILQTMGYVLEI